MEQSKFTTFEPMVTNRFIVELPSSLGIPSYLIKKVEGLEYYPEEKGFGSISLHLYNPLSPSTEKTLYDNVIYKNIKYIENIIIKTIDPVGDTKQYIILFNCKIEFIKFADLDWSKDEPTTTILNLTPESIAINGDN